MFRDIREVMRHPPRELEDLVFEEEKRKRLARLESRPKRLPKAERIKVFRKKSPSEDKGEQDGSSKRKKKKSKGKGGENEKGGKSRKKR